MIKNRVKINRYLARCSGMAESGKKQKTVERISAAIALAKMNLELAEKLLNIEQGAKECDATAAQ